MVHEATIVLMRRTAGRLRVDPAQVSGEGGPLAPALVVPVQLELYDLDGETLVLERLEATLWSAASSGGGGERLAGPVVIAGQGGTRGPLRTLPRGAGPDRLDLRFEFDQGRLRALDMHARRAASGPIALELRLEPQIGWISRIWNDPQDAESITPFGLNDGMLSEVATFWYARVDALQVQLPRDRWAEEISPRLGQDRVRLVTVELPSAAGPLGGQFASLFDAARVAHDRGDWRECIQKCRDVRHLAEERLRVNEGERIADAVSRLTGVPRDDPQIVFLDEAWKALADLTSQAHHLRTVGGLTAASAHATLLVTATLLEYLGALVANTASAA